MIWKSVCTDIMRGEHGMEVRVVVVEGLTFGGWDGLTKIEDIG